MGQWINGGIPSVKIPPNFIFQLFQNPFFRNSGSVAFGLYRPCCGFFGRGFRFWFWLINDSLLCYGFLHGCFFGQRARFLPGLWGRIWDCLPKFFTVVFLVGRIGALFSLASVFFAFFWIAVLVFSKSEAVGRR